jgi:hypothetical protein
LDDDHAVQWRRLPFALLGLALIPMPRCLRRHSCGQLTHRALQVFEALGQVLTASRSVLHVYLLKKARRERR